MDQLLSILVKWMVCYAGFAKPLSKAGFGEYSEWKPGEKIRILLVGYNGARNTGSDARVSAIARQIRDVFGAENVMITVMTLNAESLEGYFDDDVTLREFDSVFLSDLYRACCCSHAAILCEGSTLKSTFANALTLFLCEAAGVMGKQKKPCIAYGSEIGEMDPFLQKAAKDLCRDTYFITRTRDSLERLRELGLKGHAGTDTAWYYDKAISAGKAEELLRRQGWDGKKPLIGVAVINPFCWPVRASLRKWVKGKITGKYPGQYDQWYFFSDSPKRREKYRRYIHETAKAVRRFQKENDCFPVIIGMERLDEKACRHLRAQLDCPSAMFLSGETSADIMTGILRRLSLLVTSRYHAGVLSMEGGVPIVAVSMDERLDGIMHELSSVSTIAFDKDYLYHVTDEKLGAKINHAMKNADRNRERIGNEIRSQYVVYQEKLAEMGTFLKGYIIGGLQ